MQETPESTPAGAPQDIPESAPSTFTRDIAERIPPPEAEAPGDAFPPVIASVEGDVPPAAPPPGDPPRGGPDNRGEGGWGRRARRWAPVLAQIAIIAWLLLLPTRDMFRVCIPRMFYPFEVEWLEGEVANYSIRFNEHPSLGYLYPDYDKGEYCPHLYPPLYQILVSFLFRLDGSVALGWGRLVSFGATLLIMLGIGACVRSATRSWGAAAAGALLYPIFFKASGFWYDLVRVDSLGYAFAIWAVFFILRRRGGWLSLAAGGLLAALAAFTKQTTLLLPLLAGAMRVGFSVLEAPSRQGGPPWIALMARGRQLFPRRVPLRFALIPLVLLAGNGWYLVSRGPGEHLYFYLFEVPSKHFIYWDEARTWGFQTLWQFEIFFAPLLPLGLWAGVFHRRWRPCSLGVGAVAAGLAATAVSWLVLASWGAALAPTDPALAADAPGTFSTAALKFVSGSWPAIIRLSAAASVGALVVAAIRWLAYRSLLRGAAWLALLLLAQFIAVASWKKIGGYINNFMPLFLVQSVMFGIALGWCFRAARRRAPVLLSFLTAAAVLAALSLSWFGTRAWLMEARPADARLRTPVEKTPPDQLAALPWWISDGLRYDLPEIRVKWHDPKQSREVTLDLQGRAPLGWQLPKESTKEWGPKLLARLEELCKDGGVYLPHQNYLGYLAGSPIRASIDSIRDVTYVGKRTPEPLLTRIRNKEFKWIVTMMMVDGGEWMTGEMEDAIRKNYDFSGPLLPGAPWDAFQPMTGAPVKPQFLYKAKSK